MPAQPPLDVLRAAAAASAGLGPLLRALDLTDDENGRRRLRRRLDRESVDTSHWPSRGWTVYSREQLAAAVAASTSYAAVLRHLGVKQAGGTQAHLARRIRKEHLDTSHFTGQAHARGRHLPRVPTDEVLVLLPPGSARRKTSQLRRALLETGHPHVCEHCGVGSTWAGAPLTLVIDHRNGEWLDNRPDNLRFLCPNCHAQTATWCRRKGGP